MCDARMTVGGVDARAGSQQSRRKTRNGRFDHVWTPRVFASLALLSLFTFLSSCGST